MCQPICLFFCFLTDVRFPPAPRCGNSDIGWVRGMARGSDGIRILGSGSRSGRGPSSGVQGLGWGNPPCPSCRRIDPPTGWEGGFDPTAMGEQLVRSKELSIGNRNVGPKNVEKWSSQKWVCRVWKMFPHPMASFCAHSWGSRGQK